MEPLTLEEAIERLSHQDAWAILLSHIQGQYDSKIADLADIPVESLARKAGEITAYKDLLDLMDGR